MSISKLLPNQTPRQLEMGEYHYLMLLDSPLSKGEIDRLAQIPGVTIHFFADHVFHIDCSESKVADVWRLLDLRSADHPGSIFGLDGTFSIATDTKYGGEWSIERLKDLSAAKA